MTNILSQSVLKKSIGGVLVTVAFFSILSTMLIHQYLNEKLLGFLDQEIQEDAVVINELLSAMDLEDLKKLDAKTIERFAQHQSSKAKLLVAIHNESGEVILQTDFYEKLILPAQPGLQSMQLWGSHWRIFSIKNSNNFYVTVYAEERYREDVIDSVVVELIFVFLLLVPVLIVLLIIILRWAYTPLHSMADDIARRQPSDLSDFETAFVPKEALPIVEKLNFFMNRIRIAAQKEKSFVADAAHELRTPLTALSAFVQMLPPSSEKDNIEKCTNHLDIVIRQLLELHRIELNSKRHTESVRLTNIITEIVNDLIITAEAKNIEFELKGDFDFCLDSNKSLLSILLFNLLENAIKYSKPGSSIELLVQSSSLSLKNSIAEHVEFNIHRIWDRFYRGNHDHIDGTGLGLSIVAEICEQLDIDIDISREGEHFIVLLTFSQLEPIVLPGNTSI